MEDLLVIKVGGNVIDNEEALNSFLQDFSGIKTKKILVHGGGKLATALSDQLGIKTQIVNGRRVTDADSLRVVTMVYAGWVNKTIVAKLQSKNCKAIGLSGADGCLLPAGKRPVGDIDYGFVADLTAANTDLLQLLFNDDYTIVVAPVTADKYGNLLNVNADTAASMIAESMSALYRTTLVYCFEKNGLLKDVNDPRSVIATIKVDELGYLKEQRVIADGMLPKVENAARAVKNGVDRVLIGSAQHLVELVKPESCYGTSITA